jgi:O-antigen/teichoic acid export membrane protein
VSTSAPPYDPPPAFHGATLASGALLNAVAFLSSNLRAIFTFLVARLLGGAVLGTFGVAWAVADLVSKFGTLGLDYNVMAFVARSEAARDRDGSRRIMRLALSTSLRASGAVALLGCGLAVLAGRTAVLRADLASAIAVMLLGVPGIVLYRVSNGLSRGMKVMQHDVYSRGLTESLVTSGALLVAFALGARLLAPVLAAIAGTAASGLMAWALASRLYARRSGTPSGSVDSTSGLIRTSLPIAAYDLLNIGIMRVDVIMLGFFVGHAPGVTLETLGIYTAAVEVAGGLRKVSQAFTPILTPVLAEQIGAGRMRAAESSYGYVARWMLALLLPSVVVLAVSGGAILTIFGKAFHRGAPWVALAGAACALNAFVGLGETILMIQRPVWNVVNTAVAFVTAVALNLVLIPTFGALGAAVGMLVPYAFQGALRGFELMVLLRWRWPWRALLRPWGAALGALPAPLLVRAASAGRLSELVAGAVYVLAYLAIWRVIGLEPEDRAVLARLRA